MNLHLINEVMYPDIILGNSLLCMGCSDGYCIYFVILLLLTLIFRHWLGLSFSPYNHECNLACSFITTCVTEHEITVKYSSTFEVNLYKSQFNLTNVQAKRHTSTAC